jgi:hypothetical protein
LFPIKIFWAASAASAAAAAFAAAAAQCQNTRLIIQKGRGFGTSCRSWQWEGENGGKINKDL